MPVIRSVYLERDALRKRLQVLESRMAIGCATTSHPLDASAQVSQFDPYELERQVPISRTLEERMLIAERCRDADILPKVPGAGEVNRDANGDEVQIMFNGVRVLAGGYCGVWMQELIRRCRGHHEPQEEVVFAEVLRHLPRDATMFELGGYWSFYSIWFLLNCKQRRSIVVEPDPAHMAVGQENARLNGCSPDFVAGYVGANEAGSTSFRTESSGILQLPMVSVPSLMAACDVAHLNVLHCDAQGAELAVLESCVELGRNGRIEWVILSTHAHHITGDPLTHQRCLCVLRRAGATILAEHDVYESFSGDGLIVAKFGAIPEMWRSPILSYNRYSEGIFRNPAFDFAVEHSSKG